MGEIFEHNFTNPSLAPMVKLSRSGLSKDTLAMHSVILEVVYSYLCV